MISDGQLIFIMGLCGYVWVKILTLSPLIIIVEEDIKMVSLQGRLLLHCNLTGGKFM